MEAGKVYRYTYKDSGRAIFYDGEETTAKEIEKLVPNVEIEYFENTRSLAAYKLDTQGQRVGMRRAPKDSYIVIPRRETNTIPFIVMEKSWFEQTLLAEPVKE